MFAWLAAGLRIKIHCRDLPAIRHVGGSFHHRTSHIRPGRNRRRVVLLGNPGQQLIQRVAARGSRWHRLDGPAFRDEAYSGSGLQPNSAAGAAVAIG